MGYLGKTRSAHVPLSAPSTHTGLAACQCLLGEDPHQTLASWRGTPSRAALLSTSPPGLLPTSPTKHFQPVEPAAVLGPANQEAIPALSLGGPQGGAGYGEWLR